MPGADTMIATGHTDHKDIDAVTPKSKHKFGTGINTPGKPDDAKSLTSKLTNAWCVQNYFIEINGCPLRMEDVLDLEILFGGCTIPAILTIQDSDGHLTGENGKVPIAVGGSVHIQYDSIGNCHYEDDFTITKVSFLTDDRNRKLVVILMEDTDSVKAKNTYVSKGYTDKKYSEIAKEHMTKEAETNSKKKLIVSAPKEEPKANVNWHANESAFDVQQKLNKEKGFTDVKDKTKHYLVHKENKTFDKLKFQGEIFEYDVKNPFSIYRILQFNFKGFDLNMLMASMPTRQTQTNLSDVNANTKDQKEEPKAKGKNLSTGKKITNNTSTKIEDAIKIKGEKQGSANKSNTQSFNPLSNLHDGSIWVPGINKDRVGFKIQIVFPKPIGYEAVGDSDMFTTEWEVYAVRDKIIKNFFVQELFVRNPGS